MRKRERIRALRIRAIPTEVRRIQCLTVVLLRRLSDRLDHTTLQITLISLLGTILRHNIPRQSLCNSMTLDNRIGIENNLQMISVIKIVIGTT